MWYLPLFDSFEVGVSYFVGVLGRVKSSRGRGVARQNRTEAYPSLTAREHWVKYALGMATEAAYILVLTGIGYLLAMIAMVIWR